MDLEARIAQDITTALRGQEAMRLSVLRMAQAGMHNRLIEKRSRGDADALTEAEALAVVRAEAKKRREAIQAFTQGGRMAQARAEAEELKILEEYMPPEISDQELARVVEAALRESGGDAQNLGRLMQAVMQRLGGQACGARVRTMIEERLRAL